MKSRYGIWFLSLCWISLAGCANWQNRAGTIDSPGSAASLSAAPAPLGSPVIQGPGTSFGEPPPPVPPGQFDAEMNLAPLGSPPVQKLNLASHGDIESPPSGKMYNLDSAKKPSSGSVASSSKSSGKSNATLSRLASKAGSSQKPEASTEKRSMSTISRLSKDAAKETKAEPKSEVAASTPAPNSDTEALPVPTKARAAQETSTDEPSRIVDTTLLAQPVRKGADSDSSSKRSNGPQSNVMQKGSLFKSTNQPAIYPVSNPVAEEPVDIIEFS